jgi:hypothetical protein
MISHHLILILAMILASYSLHAGGIFWSDRGTNQLKRMQFDGTSLSTLALSGEVTSAGSNVRGITLDLVNERIFWADNGADRIQRANFDGSSSVILHTISGSSFPADVHLDPDARLLYWCDRTRRDIERSAFDGTSVMSAVSDAAPSGPYFMDLDRVGGKIYWGDFGDGAIYRSNLDGSGRETLLTGTNSTRGVRVDSQGGMLYWVNRNDKKVHRVPLTALGGPTPIPLTHPAVETLYDNLDTPHGLTIDIPARKIYFADTGSNAGEGQGGSAVSRGDIDGSTPMEVLASGSQPWDVELDRRCLTYDEWRRRCFRVDATPEQTTPEANPEADPFNNALEYLFNLAPLHPDGSGTLQTLLVVDSPTGLIHPAIRYPRRAGTSDLTSWVEVSPNLIEWEGSLSAPATMELQVRPLGDGMEEVTARALEPLSELPVVFMRVVVELLPTVPP